MSQEKTPQIRDLQGGSGTANYTAWLVSSKRDNAPKPREMAWPELAQLLTTPDVSDNKDGAGIVLQNLDGQGRRKENALSAWALALDVEPGTDTETGEIVQPRPFGEVCADIECNTGWLGAIYTTHSHCVPSELIDSKVQGERYRLVFPLDKPVAIATLHKAVLYVAEQLTLPVATIDPASWSAARLMYLPRHREGYPFRAQAFDGQPLRADDLEALPEVATKPAARPVVQSAGLVRVGGSDYAQTALQGEAQALASAGTGGRNNALNASALRLYRLALGGHISEVQVTTQLEQAAQAAGLTLPEIRATLESARAAANREGPAHPAERTQPNARTMPQEIAEAIRAIAAAPIECEPVAPAEDYGKCPAPFRGPMADIVRIALERQPRQQPALTVAAALAGMSAAMHGKYATSSNLRGNLYVVGLAGSTSGKGGPFKLVKTLADLAGNKPISNIGSGQGIEDGLLLTDSRRVALAIDEVGHMLCGISGQRADSHMQVAGKMLLELFSASEGTHVTRLLSNSEKPPQAIYNPYLTLYGTTTHAKMQGIDPSMIADGTLGRCLVVSGLDHAPMRELPEGMPSLWGALKHAIGDVAEAVGRYGAPQMHPDEQVISYPLDADARALQSATIARFNELESKCDGVKRVLIGRRLELALRVALVLAVWDNAGGEGGFIRREHLQWALAFVAHSQSCLLSFADEMTDSAVIKNGRKLLAMIADACEGRLKFTGAKAPAVNRMAAELKRVQHSALLKRSKLDKRAFGDAIAWLADTEEIIVEQTDAGAFYMPA